MSKVDRRERGIKAGNNVATGNGGIGSGSALAESVGTPIPSFLVASHYYNSSVRAKELAYGS